MAFPAIDNTRVNAAKHIDDWYAAEVVAGKEIPYASLAAAYAAIPSAVRMKGRSFLVTIDGLTQEYWFKDDLTTAIPKLVGLARPLKEVTGVKYLAGDISSDGTKVLNNYDLAGILFNATIYDTLPSGKTVDDVIWLRMSDGRFARRDYGYALMGAWFGLVGDGATDNTTNWNKILTNLLADGGGRVDLGVGTFMLPPFSVPLKSDICGSSLGSTVLKLLPNSPAGIFVNCNTSYSGTIQDLTINGNRANQTNVQHAVGLSAAGGNSNYKMLIRRNLIEEFTGNGIQAVSPSFIFSVESNRIRNITGWGIWNTSTDNGFLNNEVALCGQGGINNQGNNTRYIGGKILFNGHDNPDSGGIFESSSRSQYDGVECQENYYHGIVLNGSTYCKMNILTDMNNVARRPISLGGLNNIGDPTAIGYGIKMVNSQNNIIFGEIVSSVVDGNLKFTQFGKSVDSASINNTFMLKEQPQFGPDTIISGGNNTFVKHQQFSNSSVDADFTVLMGNPNVRLSATLTANRSLVMLTAQESTQKQMVIYNQNPLANAFKWIPSQPVYDYTGTAITAFPNASVIVLNQMQSGVGSATAQWRVASVYNGDFYSRAESDANIKKAKVIETTGSTLTLTATDFTGTNGEVVVLVNATSNFTLVLPSIPVSEGYRVRAVRIDNTAFTVSVKGRTLTLPNLEPINGDGLNSVTLTKDQIRLFVAGKPSGTTGYGWWTSQLVGVRIGATSGAGTFTPDITIDNQIFTGTTATWTWATVANNTWRRIFIKNRGTGNLIINSNAGANDFFVNTAVASVTVASGGAIILVNDGTYWNIE